VATIIPIILVVLVSDVSGLADLYAVGVVGAIATNLGACSTDRKLGLVTWGARADVLYVPYHACHRAFAFWDKPSARIFATTVLLFGLLLRGLAANTLSAQKRRKPPPSVPPPRRVRQPHHHIYL